jgi:hypothetical protein
VAGRGRALCGLHGRRTALQLDAPLIDALHAAGFKIAVETNGTIEAPDGIDWVCVSPKSTAPLKQITGDELKLLPPVYPQPEPSHARAVRASRLQAICGFSPWTAGHQDGTYFMAGKTRKAAFELIA